MAMGDAGLGEGRPGQRGPGSRGLLPECSGTSSILHLQVRPRAPTSRLPRNLAPRVSGRGDGALPRERKAGTGRQNSSKAGLTKVVYWVRICSRSLPRFTSRRTVGTGAGRPPSNLGPRAPPRPGAGRPRRLTSPREPDVGVGVHKQAQVEHVADLLAVEDQDALEQDHVCRVDHRGLGQPAGEISTWVLLGTAPPTHQVPGEASQWESSVHGNHGPGLLRGGLCEARGGGPQRAPGNLQLTSSGSQSRRWGPRQFCPPRCSSESGASGRYQKHLQ